MSPWPHIPYDRFKETGAALHMWSQIVGKFRLAQSPWVNHSWHATSYVTARGLTTGLVPGASHSFEVLFDFIDHELKVLCSDGGSAVLPLEAMSVAQFAERFASALSTVGAPNTFHGAPNEVPNPVPFAQQTEMGAYDRQAAQDFWHALLHIDAVFKKFRTAFLGKVSPVHLFWGSFDFAVTRFSGRDAPIHPGGFPALPDAVTREAYSHEVSSAGFWPGGGGTEEAMFYSYAYPVPEGFSAADVQPSAAYFDEALGEFLLPYEAVRTSANPEETLLSFLQTTYDAAADLGNWDRYALDCALGELGLPRPM